MQQRAARAPDGARRPPDALQSKRVTTMRTLQGGARRSIDALQSKRVTTIGALQAERVARRIDTCLQTLWWHLLVRAHKGTILRSSWSACVAFTSCLEVPPVGKTTVSASCMHGALSACET